MPDYKSMYYHLAGRMATSVEVLETTVDVLNSTVAALESNAVALKGNAAALAALKDKLKLAQQTTEEMFMNSEDDGEAK